MLKTDSVGCGIESLTRSANRPAGRSSGESEPIPRRRASSLPTASSSLCSGRPTLRSLLDALTLLSTHIICRPRRRDPPTPASRCYLACCTTNMRPRTAPAEEVHVPQSRARGISTTFVKLLVPLPSPLFLSHRSIPPRAGPTPLTETLPPSTRHTFAPLSLREPATPNPQTSNNAGPVHLLLLRHLLLPLGVLHLLYVILTSPLFPVSLGNGHWQGQD